MDIMVLIKTMIVLFGMIIVGYIINKGGILDKQGNQLLSELVVKVTSPALVLGAVCGEHTEGDNSFVLQILFIGVLLYAVYIVAAKVLVLPLRLDKKDSAVYQLMLIFANTGFMGYPILRVLYGDSSVFFASILHMPFNILIFTYGVYMLSQKSSGNGGEKEKFDYHLLLSPGVISAVLALIIYMLRIPVPEPVADILKTIGDSTIPLSMMIIGSSLALIPIRDAFSDVKVYFFSAIKLLLVPALVYLLGRLVTRDPYIIGLMVVSAAMPSGSLVVMLATKYNSNVKAASIGVFITTLLSVVTIPAVVYLLLA